MSKLATLAKARAASKRSQSVASTGDDSLPEPKKPLLSSVGLLDKLHKKDDGDSATPRTKPLSKLASKALNGKFASASGNSQASALPRAQPSKQAPSPATNPPPTITAADMFPDIDFNCSYDPLPMDFSTQSELTSVICEPAFSYSLESYGPSSTANFIYNPSNEAVLQAFSQPSPDDIVLQAQTQAKGFDGEAANGIAKMRISETLGENDFTSKQTALNFFVVGR